MIALDLFCGAGGLTRGLADAGIEVKLGVDVDSRCAKSFESNNPRTAFLAEDVCDLDRSKVLRLIGATANQDVLIAACAPCQPFAQLNRTETADARGVLLREVARLTRELLPRAVLIENVPGIRLVEGYSTYRRLARMLTDLKYSVCVGVLDAKHFGVPQTRRRFVLLALRGKAIEMPSSTHGPGLVPFRTVRDAIAHYPRIAAGEQHHTVPNHRAAKLSITNSERMQHTPHDGGSRMAWPKHLWLPCHKKNVEAHTDSYGRMRWDRPAPTLTCKCHSLSNGRYGHPEQDRAISLREAATLQCFPEDYEFHGTSLAGLATQIGNAVPVSLARLLGNQILTALDT